MKNETKKSLTAVAFLISIGLITAFLLFFLLFGKGLQILMPCILFAVFFTLFFILGKISITAQRPLLKIIISVLLVIVVAIII